jgi:hypothetical protein
MVTALVVVAAVLVLTVGMGETPPRSEDQPVVLSPEGAPSQQQAEAASSACTNVGTTTGALVLNEQMRVFVEASILGSKGTGLASSAGQFVCRVASAPVGGSFTDLSPIGALTRSDAPAGTAVYGTLTFSSAVTLNAGSYDFKIQCYATNVAALGQAQIVATESSLHIVAAAV